MAAISVIGYQFEGMTGLWTANWAIKEPGMEDSGGIGVDRQEAREGLRGVGQHSRRTVHQHLQYRESRMKLVGVTCQAWVGWGRVGTVA